MILLQILLPLFRNDGRRFPSTYYAKVRSALLKRFDGLTVYARSPAQGTWRNGKENHKEQIIVYEIVAPKFETAFWKKYRRELERQFCQEEVMIRYNDIKMVPK